MKKLFLLTGMLFSFVLVRAMGVNEPPGVNYVNSVVCSVSHLMTDAVADVYVMVNAYSDAGCEFLKPDVLIENADCGNEIVLPDALAETYQSIDIFDRGDIVSRNGVIKSNEFSLTTEPNLTLKFEAKARSWVNLTIYDSFYLCLRKFSLTNFDGNPLRFY